jgi:hypothetical protein
MGIHVTNSVYLRLIQEYLRTHGEFLEFIRFRNGVNADHTDSNIVSDIVAFCPNTKLLFTGGLLENSGFVQIVQNCQLLERVVIAGCRVFFSGIAALNNCPNLKSLVFYTHVPADHAVKKLLITCPALEVLEFHVDIYRHLNDDLVLTLKCSE